MGCLCLMCDVLDDSGSREMKFSEDLNVRMLDDSTVLNTFEEGSK